MTRRLLTLAAVGLLASLAACGGSEPDVAPTAAAATTAASESSTTEAAPLHAIPADPLVVTGSATCSFTNGGAGPEGGAGPLVVCQLDMSDPRVSGTETHDRLRFFSGGEVGDVWVAEEARITNTAGTWLGSVQAADDGKPSGEARYVGEGVYQGLEFHYYFGGSDSAGKVIVRGWISGGG